MIRKILSFTAAASLAVAPVIAQAANPVPVAPEARAGAAAGDSQLVERVTPGMGWLLPGLIVLAAILGGFLIFGDDDDPPESP